MNLENEVRDTIVKVIVNEKPVVNIDIKATTPNVFVPNRIEHLIELEKFEIIIKKIINLEPVEIIVFEPEVSEFLEEAHTDIWLNLKKKYILYLNHATPIVGEDLQDNILAVNS